MSIPASLAVGQHMVLADPADGWKVELLDSNPPGVRLIASIAAGPKPPIFPGPSGETTVAIPMDVRVAIGLYEQLGDLIRTMGWQQHISGGRPI